MLNKIKVERSERYQFAFNINRRLDIYDIGII